MQTTKQTNGLANEALKELALVRDEARLRWHLLSMDARKRWQELEDKVESLEQSLRRRGEKANEAVLTAARDLSKTARDFLNSKSNSGH
jgi:hypothetical protein